MKSEWLRPGSKIQNMLASSMWLSRSSHTYVNPFGFFFPLSSPEEMIFTCHCTHVISSRCRNDSICGDEMMRMSGNWAKGKRPAGTAGSGWPRGGKDAVWPRSPRRICVDGDVSRTVHACPGQERPTRKPPTRKSLWVPWHHVQFTQRLSGYRREHNS